ncbi:MAG TPA: hypothetical protein VMR25_12140 [Planctomycetaceae bacterium]|jgi:hypothetical protein|nr:hypothetical protein [Planctomycetaceae bacterium]
MAEATSRSGGWSRAVNWLVATCLVMALACGILATILWQMGLRAPTLDAGIQFGLESLWLMLAAGVSLIVGLIALAGRLWSQGRGGIVSRLASGVVAIAYVSLAVAQVGSRGIIVAPIVLIPVGIIWCSQWLGKATLRRGGATTWPLVIASVGWLFLLGFPVLITVLSR